MKNSLNRNNHLATFFLLTIEGPSDKVYLIFRIEIIFYVWENYFNI